MLTPSVRAFNATTPEAPPRPPDTPKDTEFSFNPQDRVVMNPTTTVVKQVKPGPETARFDMKGAGVQPNKDGKYVFDANSAEGHAAVAFSAATKTLEMFEGAFGAKVNWAFRGEQLEINPDNHDREWLNAYYSRGEGSVNFFHQHDPVTNTTVQSGHSGEIVAHEVGHAILDGLRPGYLGGWSSDVGGFHESFGDMVAILMNTQDERAVARVIAQTDGDLRKPNIMSSMAEELGRGINDTRGKNATGGDLIRQAVNNFKWAEPSTLPERGGPDRLGSEAHDFSRLWTGAFYDILAAITDEKKAAGVAPKDAIREAGAECTKLLANLMKEAPRGTFTYRQMAEAFVRSDQQHNGGARANLIRDIYTNREILPKPGTAEFVAEEPIPESTTYRMVQTTLRGSEFGAFEGATVKTPVDNGFPLGKDTEAARRTQTDLKRLIANGRIKMTNPGQKIETKDLFDAQGRAYIGVAKWDDQGQMFIERVDVLT